MNQQSFLKAEIMNNPLRISRFLFILIITISDIFCSVFHLAPQVSNQTEYIRLNSIHEINEPKLKLNNIYKRQVYEIISDKDMSSNDISEMRPFQPCLQYPAEVQFQPMGYYQLSMNDQSKLMNYQLQQTSSSIIYDYEILKSQFKNIVDMTYYNNHIFTISSTGVIRVYKVDDKLQQGIQLKKTIDAIMWDKLIDRRLQRMKQEIIKKTGKNDSTIEEQLAKQMPEYLKIRHIKKGYFQLIDQTQLMLFANGQILIGIDIETLSANLLSEETQIQVVFSGNQELTENQNDSQDQGAQNDNEQDQNQDQDQSQLANQEDQDGQDDSDSDFSQYKVPGMDFTLKIHQKYKYLQNFQSIVKIDQTHFAVLDKSLGVIIYQVQKSTSDPSNPNPLYMYDFKKVDKITKDDFWYIYAWDQDMNLVDMKYSKEKGLLLVLDYDKGVFAFERNAYGKLQPQTVSFKLSFNRILKKQCTLMEYSSESQSLYLSCNKIHRVFLNKWPMVQQKTYPHPMINIREIFPIESQNLLVFAGYSTFKLLYLDRLADYYEDQMLDKIIFHDGNKVVTANQDAIYVYDYWVEKPVIVCEPRNEAIVGQHYVLLQTTAQCTQQFLKNLSQAQQPALMHDDGHVCVYSTYKTLFIWKQGEIPQTSMLIMFVVFIVLSVILLFWILMANFRTWRAKSYLQSLATATHTILVQQGEQKTTKYSSNNDISSRESAQTGESINKVAGSLTTDHQPQEKL